MWPGGALRHDHGGTFIADDFQQEIVVLSIEDSASCVREPQGNGIAERFVRILRIMFVGTQLPTCRGTPAGAFRLPESLQPVVADRSIWLRIAGSGQGKTKIRDRKRREH